MATSVLPSPVFISAILPLVQDHAADQLHVEVPHVERAAAGLADDGEGFGQQVVERLAVGEPLAELDGLAAQLLVGERWIAGSSALTSATSGRRRFSSRSFSVPTTLARSVSTIIRSAARLRVSADYIAD